MTKYPIREIRFEELAAELKCNNCAEPMIYAVLRDGVRYEFLIKSSAGSRQAVVFGTGHLTISREEWPFFSRQSWMNEIPCSCIYYFDPTLYLGPIELAWCYGTNERWYLREIADILEILLKALDVPADSALMMGSSGGGFTSIMLATMLRARCMAINPQTDFRHYLEAPVEKLRQTVLRPDEDWIDERADAVELMKREGFVPYVHIYQNVIVERDLKDHIIPLIQKYHNMGMGGADCGYGKIKLDFYQHPDGHNAMPMKKLCIAGMLQDLEAACLDTISPSDYRKSPVSAAYSVSGRDLTVRLDLGDRAADGSWEFAYYLYRKKQVVTKIGYSRESEHVFDDLEPGDYSVKYFIRTAEGKQSYSMPILRII